MSSQQGRPSAPDREAPVSQVPVTGSIQPVAAFCQCTTALDVVCFLAAGLLWRDAAAVSVMFTPLELSLAVIALAALGSLAMLRLAPVSLGRMLDVPWAIADAVLVPAYVGGSLALGAYVIAEPAYVAALMLWPLAATTLLLPSRIFMSGLARRGVRDGWLRRRVAVVGATEMSRDLIQRMNGADNREMVKLVGIFDDRDATRRPPEVAGVGVRGDIAGLCSLAVRERLDLIVIALPLNRAVDILRSVQQVRPLSAEVVVLLDGEHPAPRRTRQFIVAGQPVLQLVRPPLRPGSVVAKACQDYLIGALCLVIFAPAMLLCAIAIRMQGPGPVLCRQARVGRNGRVFQILKLRTLIRDPQDAGARGVPENGPRLTRVGEVIRALCLDELPQLVNVLRGEMSLVGPRPHVAGMLVAGRPIDEIVSGYWARHRMKPGITGWAQVNGLSGTMTDAGMARAVVTHDLAYLSERSVWLDLRILARTAVIALFGRSAFRIPTREWRGL